MLRRARSFCFLLRAATSVSKPPCPPSGFSRALFLYTASRHSFHSFSDDDKESLVYKRYLQCRQLPSILQPNTCSLIGTVVMPPRSITSKTDWVCAYTILEVQKPPTHACSPFQIMIWMWNDLARVALRHLKPNDFIYVSGRVSFYEKAGANGKREIIQKVLVREMNFVERQAGTKVEDACTLGRNFGDEDQEEKKRECLRLWQIFFANPHEWWDNRRNKRNRRSPDFKHKHTGEALWIDPRHPPWVMKQLELIDFHTSRSVDSRNRHASDLI